MLTLGRPGQSPYSVVREPACGADPATREPGCPSEAVWSGAHGGWVRRENADEAKERWRGIAEVIAREVERATTGDAPIWPGDPSGLARALVTVSFHESGFRRDVHEGVGPLAVGDCIRVAGRKICRSFCLVQISTGGPDLERFGHKGRELVGLDDAATSRCIATGIRVLAQVRGGGARWFRETIARYGGGSPRARDTGWVAERVATFDRLGAL